ncbi:MAG: aminotransferase class I/II-fold pyridoxal phosphate-dependent enzyme, partial [Pseudomonadales bacterium]|nr:aminotransferase class I/II-fold pyridoxal phosphate-dependent enzyme [Pseudomonadales bacterium]
ETAPRQRDYSADTWQKVREEREKLRLALQSLGWEIPPSQANFLLASVPGNPGAEEIYRRLKDNGILVRYFDQPRLKDKLRISVGTPAENDRLLTTLGRILEGKA